MVKYSISQLVPQTKSTEQSYQTCPYKGVWRMYDVKLQSCLCQMIIRVLAIFSFQKHLGTDWSSPNDVGYC